MMSSSSISYPVVSGVTGLRGFSRSQRRRSLVIMSIISVSAHPHLPIRISSSSSSPCICRCQRQIVRGRAIKKLSLSRSVVVSAAAGGGVPLPPLDLTEDNVCQVLADARLEFAHVFDVEAGMTGEVGLAELDGPFVKISLKGRFWHERSMVLARVGNYLKQRIPEILEVDIEDEKQLDDSPDNF